VIDPMTDKPMKLEQKVCHMEGGAEQVSIAQVCEVLSVLAELFESDPESVYQFEESYRRTARDRATRQVVREALHAAGMGPQPRKYPPPDPED
jgi:hypothetical protein